MSRSDVKEVNLADHTHEGSAGYKTSTGVPWCECKRYVDIHIDTGTEGLMERLKKFRKSNDPANEYEEEAISQRGYWNPPKEFYFNPNDFKLNNNEENKMRRVVNVELIDDDKGLPADKALVFSADGIVTEDDNQTVVNEIIMDYGIAEYLDDHNKVRVEIVDEEILKRTGNTVNLRPVKLKDLRWVVKG